MAASFFPEAGGVAHILEGQLLLLKPFVAVHGAQRLFTGGNQVLVLTFACITPTTTLHTTLATLRSTGCSKPVSPLTAGWLFLSYFITRHPVQRGLEVIPFLVCIQQAAGSPLAPCRALLSMLFCPSARPC